MLDWIPDAIENWFDYITPVVVVDEFERGVLLRWGKCKKELDPGLHWKWPLADRALLDNVVPRTINLKAQSLTTKDGKSVVIGAVVTASIRDIQKALLDVETVDNVLEDSCYGQVAALVAATDWEQIRGVEFNETLTAACRKQAFRFGVEITRVQLSDVAISRALRLYQASAI